jgi:hypothetical protein
VGFGYQVLAESKTYLGTRRTLQEETSLTAYGWRLRSLRVLGEENNIPFSLLLDGIIDNIETVQYS